MAETPVHVANERLKGLTGVIYNLATALFATAAARTWSDGGITLPTALWIIGAAILIWVASQLLSLPETEQP